jgi:hypothetical protein
MCHGYLDGGGMTLSHVAVAQGRHLITSRGIAPAAALDGTVEGNPTVFETDAVVMTSARETAADKSCSTPIGAGGAS